MRQTRHSLKGYDVGRHYFWPFKTYVPLFLWFMVLIINRSIFLIQFCYWKYHYRFEMNKTKMQWLLALVEFFPLLKLPIVCDDRFRIGWVHFSLILIDPNNEQKQKSENLLTTNDHSFDPFWFPSFEHFFFNQGRRRYE